MRRLQLMVTDKEYDYYVSYFYDGIRARVIRNLLRRACECIEDEHSDVTVDAVVRGEFDIQDKDHGGY